MQYLYLIRSQRSYKIGIAVDVKNRLAQLQTGNPNLLELVFCFSFEDAQSVERAIHQRFDSKRSRGEWFNLEENDIDILSQICELLGGKPEEDAPVSANSESIEEAEEAQAAINEQGLWDYQQMLRDGWRMEPASSRGASDKYWAWMRTKGASREYIYGGRLADLPYPSLEEMRRIFRDGKLYQPYIKKVIE